MRIRGYCHKKNAESSKKLYSISDVKMIAFVHYLASVKKINANGIKYILEQANKGECFAKKAAEGGRIYHRNWIVHTFGPLIKNKNNETIDALVAATDIYIYKLLRLDMGRSIKATGAVIKRLIRGVLEEKP